MKNLKNQQTGRILIIGQTYQVPSNTPGAQPFYKRELVLDASRFDSITGQKFENYPKFEFINQKCSLLDQFQVGQLVTVSFALSGRKSEKDGQVGYFTNVTGYEIVPYQRQGTQPAAQTQQVMQPQAPVQAAPFPATAPTGVQAQQPFPPAVDENGNPIGGGPDDLPF
jgi:hypothetical protein